MKRWIRSALVGLVALAPAAALAAIDNTHHDMVRFTGQKERCAYCHGRQLAQASPTPVTYGSVGTFCVVVCHDGAVVTSAIPAAPGYYLDTSYTITAGASGANIVSFTQAHGRDTTVLNTLAGEPAGAVAATGWPHSSKALMECTTCHTVHDATNPPFLNGPLSTGVNSTSFCQRCHTGATHLGAGRAGRFQDIASMGAHPTEFTLILGTVNRTAPKLGRRIEFKSPIFNRTVASANAAAFNNAVGTQWPTGGHLMDTVRNLPSSNATPTGVFGCYTCHSAHQNANVGGFEQTGNMLLLANPRSLGHSQSPLCAGCHGLAAGNGVNNPGLTNFYHPVNLEAVAPFQHDHNTHAAGPNLPNTGSFPIAMSAGWTGAAAAFKGQNGSVVCGSCHDVHGGVGGLMALRALGTSSPTQAQCLFCHADSTGTQAGANWHHPGGTGNYQTSHGMPATLGWHTIDNLGRLTDGLSCPDCHVFQGTSTRRATAHNW